MDSELASRRGLSAETCWRPCRNPPRDHRMLHRLLALPALLAASACWHSLPSSLAVIAFEGKRLHTRNQHLRNNRGFQRHFPMDGHWHFPTEFHFSVECLKRIVTFPVDVHWNCPMDFQWHFPMKCHLCDFWCEIFVLTLAVTACSTACSHCLLAQLAAAVNVAVPACHHRVCYNIHAGAGGETTVPVCCMRCFTCTERAASWQR